MDNNGRTEVFGPYNIGGVEVYSSTFHQRKWRPLSLALSNAFRTKKKKSSGPCIHPGFSAPKSQARRKNSLFTLLTSSSHLCITRRLRKMRSPIAWLSLLAVGRAAASTSPTSSIDQPPTTLLLHPATTAHPIARGLGHPATVTVTVTIGVSIGIGEGGPHTVTCTVTDTITERVTDTTTERVTDKTTNTVTSKITETISATQTQTVTDTYTKTVSTGEDTTITNTITDTVTKTTTKTEAGGGSISSLTVTETISAPAKTITQVSPTTITAGDSTVTDTTISTVTEDQQTITLPASTITLSGSFSERTSTLTVTVDGSTITAPVETVTGPPLIEMETVLGTTSTIPASTITIVTTLPASTITLPDGTSIIPGSTKTTVISQPPSIVTAPGSTKTATVTTNDSTHRPDSEETQTVSTGSTVTLHVSVCSTLISNPTYTPESQLPVDYTWGCAPGFLCFPSRTGKREGCDVESGLPADGYICTPSDCIVAPPLVLNESWALDADGHHYNFSRDYYNLNPEDFGLTYDIFESTKEHNATHSKRNVLPFGSGPGLFETYVGKRDLLDIPGVCYNDCNDAALEQQATGKKPELCESDSAYLLDLGNCETCITHHADSSSDAFSSSLLPSFAQFLNYCSDLSRTSTSTTSQTSTSQSSATSTADNEETETSIPPAPSSEEPDITATTSPGRTASTTRTGISTTSESNDDTTSPSSSRPTGSTVAIGSAKIIVSVTIPSSSTITGPATVSGFDTIESTRLFDSTTQPSSLGQNDTKSSLSETKSTATTNESANGSHSGTGSENSTGSLRDSSTEPPETPRPTGGETSPVATTSFNLAIRTLQPTYSIISMFLLSYLTLLI
ncbi:hypothetical protein PENSTE_c019G03450 [Penicillium steckii]|uniref:Uncharacterized protein n=1 Tax=Penicillium steckii TaxID=303698 RepID=A0A1V6SVG8_9EURO|nr:hypothetical protein PENSTE_c019G03450 [Penicillium steckii]